MAKRKKESEGITRLAANFIAAVGAPPDLRVCDTITTDTGWLSPTGEFYPCGEAQHRYLADTILRQERQRALKRDGFWTGGENKLETRGWIRIQVIDGEQYFVAFHKDTAKPTVFQVKSVQDYCKVHGCRVPYWAESQ